jgi:beta-phosphoglucomutase-like phosphatase (HAD superfamily)/dTDP-glucose pyrophosphorylase
MSDYNKLVIFDLDGVLIDSRDVHYHALNMALESISPLLVISREEHLSTYDGLPTTAKLKLLTEKKNLPPHVYDDVWKEKQSATIKILSRLQPDYKLIDIFRELKERGFKIAVASNSIRNTVVTTLVKLGLMEYIDYYQSNEDVSRNKPFPEMYWNCMMALYAIPSTTIIVEDSHIGRQGAIDSGAKLLPVEDAHDLTWGKIMEAIDTMTFTRSKIPWRDAKLNVLIPMAGAGSRFAQQGYTFPKPLIEVHGKPMIQVIVENLNIEANYHFIVQKEHYDKYNLKYLLNLIAPGCTITQVDGLTSGAAVTTLIAREYIDNDQPLLIANSDQFLEWNSNEIMYAFNADSIDAGILTFKATHPKWSYAKLDDNGFVSEVAEKKVISDNATVGVYFWKRGSDYVKYAERMMKNDANRVNGEWYVCPVFNEAIQDGKKVRVKHILKMWGIGTPEDLNTFLADYKGTV